VKHTGPEPEDDDRANDDGTPVERRINVTPGEPVTFEVPANTNLVINVVNDKPRGCLTSLWSGLSCFATGFVVLVIVFWIIGSFRP
jgi:hypothetical protein